MQQLIVIAARGIEAVVTRLHVTYTASIVTQIQLRYVDRPRICHICFTVDSMNDGQEQVDRKERQRFLYALKRCGNPALSEAWKRAKREGPAAEKMFIDQWKAGEQFSWLTEGTD